MRNWINQPSVSSWWNGSPTHPTPEVFSTLYLPWPYKCFGWYLPPKKTDGPDFYTKGENALLSNRPAGKAPLAWFQQLHRTSTVCARCSCSMHRTDCCLQRTPSRQTVGASQRRLSKSSQMMSSDGSLLFDRRSAGGPITRRPQHPIMSWYFRYKKIVI